MEYKWDRYPFVRQSGPISSLGDDSFQPSQLLNDDASQGGFASAYKRVTDIPESNNSRVGKSADIPESRPSPCLEMAHLEKQARQRVAIFFSETLLSLDRSRTEVERVGSRELGDYGNRPGEFVINR
ncbi:hypothetical protein KM043_006031 [Ampulex compressa]|nr:hypothetical protein KM043_006031 [Ampulex compressa]